MTAPSGTHIPVLLADVLARLLPDTWQPGGESPDDVFVDCTLGGGGHSQALIERYQSRFGDEALRRRFVLVGIDQDAGVLAQTQERLSALFPALRAHYCHSNFDRLPACLTEAGLSSVTLGLLADIGVSSFQLDQAERGFSFSKDAPLDMRMDPSAGQTAADVVNTYDEQALVRIFSDYGEERFSKTLARLIVETRRQTPFERTRELAGLIETLYRQKLPPKAYRIHPATKVFQAIRIEVNRELAVLESLIDALPAVLAPHARAAIIGFHSLEDRIVKHRFRALAQAHPDFSLVTRKPVEADEDEAKRNPRARSAKLRVLARDPASASRKRF